MNEGKRGVTDAVSQSLNSLPHRSVNQLQDRASKEEERKEGARKTPNINGHNGQTQPKYTCHTQKRGSDRVTGLMV